MKNVMLILLCLGSAVALVLAVFKFLHRQWFPGMFLAVIGVSVVLMTLWSVRIAARIETPMPSPDSAAASGRIVMQVAVTELNQTLFWALGFLIAAVALVQSPDVLWTKWLAYPAAFLALLLVGVMILITMSQRLERVVADARCIEVSTEARGASVRETLVAWTQVGAVKRREVHINRTISRDIGRRTFLRCELVLLDRAGGELLKLSEPLDPPASYKLFLESVPRWTGLPVVNEQVTE